MRLSFNLEGGTRGEHQCMMSFSFGFIYLSHGGHIVIIQNDFNAYFAHQWLFKHALCMFLSVRRDF